VTEDTHVLKGHSTFSSFRSIILLGLHDPEDESMIVQNAGNLLTNNTASQPRQFEYSHFSHLTWVKMGTAVAQWLRYCATNQKVAGSIPDGVIGIVH
jgi:hypothetical protein